MSDDVTNGELARRMADLAARLERLDRKLDRSYIHRDVYLSDKAAFGNRLEVLEEKAQWAPRQFLTAILLPTVTALITAYILTR